MNIGKKIIAAFLYIFVLLVTACSTSERNTFVIRNIKTRGFDVADLKDSLYVDVSLLKTYANEQVCDNKIKNANLYICRNISTGDTLYVFDLCDKVAPFATENLHENFAILIEDIKTNIPDSVSILVPDSFKIPPNAKLVFSNLTRLLD